MISALYLNAQETFAETDSAEEALCREVAQDIINIYDSWDPQRDFDILYPRVEDFVETFYSDFPDFTFDLIVKEQVLEIYKDNPGEVSGLETDYPEFRKKVESEYPGVIVKNVVEDIKRTGRLTDYEKRALVAYKAMKTDKIFEEIARFITTKDFYWGYISDDLDKSLNDSADKIKNYTLSRQDELLQIHNEEVNTLLEEVRSYEMKIDSVESLNDMAIVAILNQDDEYNTETYRIEKRIDSLKTAGADQGIILKVSDEKNRIISEYIDVKKEKLTENLRLERIAAKEYWLERKRTKFFDIKEEESYRLNDLVSEFLIPLEEERSIGSFDITDSFILLVHQNAPEAKTVFLDQIRYKYYSGLISTFGSYVIFNKIPEFRTYRINVLIGTILFIILFFYIFIQVKKNKEKMFIRRIPGLDAIDDAVGRATEMGKPIIYDSGIGYQTQIETIASMLILRSVSKKVAEFKAEIYVPTCDPIVMQISEEMVASGFLDAGYPEDHKKDNIFFLAADQFAFAAGVAGILSRKKPATAFHFGYYMAESLLISEAGFAAGAIQVAGTTQASQLPFFITACDYTLIGEELYAAAAYISRDAQIMTNLKLSDYAKITIGFIFIIGTILLTINSEWTFLQDLLFTR